MRPPARPKSFPERANAHGTSSSSTEGTLAKQHVSNYDIELRY